MVELFRRSVAILFAGIVGMAGAAIAQPSPSGDPPARVGRLAFIQGMVSFHDNDQSNWAPAVVNQPLTSGDAIWTEPKAHSEISIAGTRVRMDGATQLDMTAIDDSRTRLQLDQGRVDIKTLNLDARQPYELATPRGVASLERQGDYYVEAGSTQDPTRLGVRQGAAQFQAPDGRVLAVRAGEVAEISGDGSTMELHTIQAPPPPMPQYWAARDRIAVYEQPPQYLSAGITGYEDLNYYGTWQNDPQYGQVWYVRDAPSGWAPYSTGRWTSDPVYGWTWVDEQPWGFAPYHYGRWAQRGDRWFWVPPERSQPAVYAPALVAFVGGLELGVAIGQQSRAPVGWFPLGPREVYVPPYTANRDYYRRLNLSARVEDRILEERWERAQRREAITEQNWMNRRFATVVPADAFARSQPVQRAALRIAPEKIAAVPVAAVSVPPSPTVSVRAIQAPSAQSATAPATRPGQPSAPVTGQTGATAPTQAHQLVPQALKPEPTQQKAPGPQIATRAAAPTTDQKPALPKLEPRNASAPPLPQIQGERKPATTQPGSSQATAPATQPTAPAPPTEQNRTQPGQPQPGQANLPPVRDRGQARPEPPKPGEPPKSPQATTTSPQPPKPGEPPNSPQATTTPPQPPKPGEPPNPGGPPKPQEAQQPAAPGQPSHKAEPPKPQGAATPQPQRQAEPPKPQQAQQPMTPVQPPHQAQPPKPEGAVTPPPQQQRQAEPPKPQGAVTPPPQQQRQAEPPRPQQAQQPVAPPQPQRQAEPPRPQQAQQPAPPPQPQRQAAPPPVQPQHQAPPPAQAHPAPQQQAQSPAPAPQQHAAPPQQQQHPAPQPQQGQKKDDDKK